VLKAWRLIVDGHRQHEEASMGFEPRGTDFGDDEVDHVSVWLLKLAIAMMVVGIAFATLDWLHWLPKLPGTAAVAHAPAEKSELKTPG
jgi:hypothetical protein